MDNLKGVYSDPNNPSLLFTLVAMRNQIDF